MAKSNNGWVAQIDRVSNGSRNGEPIYAYDLVVRIERDVEFQAGDSVTLTNVAPEHGSIDELLADPKIKAKIDAIQRDFAAAGMCHSQEDFNELFLSTLRGATASTEANRQTAAIDAQTEKSMPDRIKGRVIETGTPVNCCPRLLVEVSPHDLSALGGNVDVWIQSRATKRARFGG